MCWPAPAADLPPPLRASRHSFAETITAQPGDTLWSIGRAHHGSVSISRYVDKLVDIDGGASIEAGQAVLLP